MSGAETLGGWGALALLAVARGSLYALIALGFALVFGVGRVPNLFHGGFFLMGAYGAHFVSDAIGATGPGEAVTAALVSATATGALGWLYYATLVRRHTGDPIRLLAIGLVANLLAAHVLQTTYGTRAAYVRPIVAGSLELGTARVLWQEVVVLAAALVLFPLLAWVLRATPAGRAIRAVAEDARGARLVGISPERVLGMAFAAAAVLAALAGALSAPLRVVLPDVWAFALLKSFVVVIVGGVGSLGGCLAAAYGLGAVEVLGTGLVGEGKAEMLSVVIALVVLALRPRGLVDESA